MKEEALKLAYELAGELDGAANDLEFEGINGWKERAGAEMLRQQADRIKKLQKYVGFKESGYDIIQLPSQTKPLSDEEIDKLADEYLSDYFNMQETINFARAIEERHGIK